MQAAELLDLDPEVLRAHAEAYEGFATVDHVPQRGKHPPWLRANYLAIAASYWSTIDLERGRKCFEYASQFAFEQVHEGESAATNVRDRPQPQMPWELRAATMAVCARNGRLVKELAPQWSERKSVLSPSALMFALVTAGQLVFDGELETATRILGPLQDRAYALENHPAGNLQLPLGFFTRLIAQAITARKSEGQYVSDRDARVEAVRGWTFQFSHRLSERVAVAQSNRYHWRRLYTRLLPLEPEAICTLLIWAQSLRRTARNQQEIRNLTSNLSPAMQAHLETVNDILHEGGGGSSPTRV
jgi:hypothetical protein